MTTIHNPSHSASFTTLFGRLFAFALLFISLAATGCDFVDSNAVMDEPQVHETRLLALPTETLTLQHVADTESSCVKDKQGGSFVCMAGSARKSIDRIYYTTPVPDPESSCVKDKQGGSFVYLTEDGTSKNGVPAEITPIWCNKEEVSILGPPAVAPGEDDHYVGRPEVDDEASEKP